MNDSAIGGAGGGAERGVHGSEGSTDGGVRGEHAAEPNAALAAARAALAALDKANTDNGSETSSRDELAAAWQALTALGGEHGDDARPSSPSGGEPRASAARGGSHEARSDAEWALPVVEAPPTRFGADAGSELHRDPAPTARGRDAAADWALPVLDAPTARIGTDAGLDTHPTQEPTTPGHDTGADWALPGLQAPTPPAGPDNGPPTRRHGDADADRFSVAPSDDAGATSGSPFAASPGAHGPAGPTHRERAPRPRLGGDPDAPWAAPVLDAPPATTAPGGPQYGSPFPGSAPDDDRRPTDAAHHAAEARSATSAGTSGRGRPDADAGADHEPGQEPAQHLPGRKEPDEHALAEVRDVLTAGGAPARLAGQAWDTLGPGAAGLLRHDPWNLLALSGISPQQADLFARTAQGGHADPDEPGRTGALIQWHLQRAADEGHTAVDAASAASELADFGVRDPRGALRAAYESGRVMAFAERPAPGGEDDRRHGESPEESGEFADDDLVGDDFDDPFEGPADRVLVALERYALAEEGIAEAVVRLVSTASSPTSAAFDASPLGHALRESGVVLQVTGAGEDPPGAALELALALADSAGLRTVVACPTFDGAARVREFLLASTATASARGELGVTTVRALLGDRSDVMRDADGFLGIDLLVVTEAQLLDARTAASLLEVLPDGARVVLCGDADELEPPGTGRVFADIRDSGVVPVVVSAARASGDLGSLAAAVRAGSLPPVESPDRQVVLVGARTAAEAVHRCVQLVGDSIPRVLGIASDDVLVVTPADGGSAGATALNAALKERLNPGPGRYAGFDVGDRVVRVPGPRTPGHAEGRVVDAVPEGLAVAFRDAPDLPVTVPRARLGELRLGWAVTVRQSLGTRRAGVVAMLPGDAGPLVTRALVYTAFTRARRHLSVVYPVGGTLPQSVAREDRSVRTTRLGAALREAAGELFVPAGTAADG